MKINNSSRGISLISLIITIIVIIILAAIVIFTGLNTPDRANYAKFLQNISDFQLAATQDFMNRKSNYILNHDDRSNAQIYYIMATGNEIDMNTEPVATGKVSELGIDGLKGTDYYLITDDKNITNWNKNQKYYAPDEKHYITDEGDVFVLPGYRVEEEEEEKYYVAAGKYYAGEAKEGAGELPTGTMGGVNAPVLGSNMIPVYYDGSQKVWKKANITNEGTGKYYDYATKQWANMVTVKPEVRSTYSRATVGTEVKEDDVLGYWVWIPRYAYKADTTNKKFDIKFLKGTTDEPTDGNELPEGYIVHPVFKADTSKGGWTSELSGIWVAKFESGSSKTELKPDEGYTLVKANSVTGAESGQAKINGSGLKSSTIGKIDNVNRYGSLGTSDEFVVSKPNITSWRNISIKNASSKSQDVSNKHGISSDSHMMKNTEWGAVAYLTQSSYGNGSQIWNNPYNEGEIYSATSNDYGMGSYAGTITGMCGTDQNQYSNYYSEKIEKTYNEDGSIKIKYTNILEDATTDPKGKLGADYERTYYPYNHASNNGKSSTTGNVYGIYDMAGGAWEYMAAYVNNGYANIGSYIGSFDPKYVNIYEKGEDDGGTSAYNEATYYNQNYNANKAVQKYLGDATFETSTAGTGASSWNSDCSYFPAGSGPAFIRGGHFDYGGRAGVFAFYYYAGGGYTNLSFRVVLVP